MSFLRLLTVAAAIIAVAAPLSADAAGTLDKIKARKVIALGYRDASVPFSYIGNDGKPWGYSIELCTKVAKAVQQQLKLPSLDIKWVLVEPANRIAKLQKGEIDLECGSTTANLNRMNVVDFSLLTFADGGSYLTKNDSGINSLADLKGRKTGVAVGTTTEKTLKDAIEKKLFDSELVLVKDHDDGVKALHEGRVDAYASDRGLLAGLLLATGNKDIWTLGSELYSYEPYALMLRRNDADFRLAVNRELVRIYRSREIYDIYDRWFGVIGKPGPLFDSMTFLLGLPD